MSSEVPRISSFAALLYVDGAWIASNPAQGIEVELEDLSPSALALLAELVTTLVRAPSHAGASDVTPELISAARQIGLLLGQEEREGEGEQAWIELAVRYPALREIARHLSAGVVDPDADYSVHSVFDRDRQVMEAYAASSPPPPVCKRYEDASVIRLSHPAHQDARDEWRDLSHLLFWGFGILREARFLEILPALLKPVPSFGARHPFEAYLECGEGCPFDPGLYHYDAAEHALALIEPRPNGPKGAARLIVTALYERMQWRYRDALTYRNVFHDLGHVLETLDVASLSLGLTLAADALPPPTQHWAPLWEEPVACLQIQRVDP